MSLKRRSSQQCKLLLLRTALESFVSFLEYMFVPLILLITIAVPIWITLHYRSLNNSNRALSDDDRRSLNEVLEAVDRMTDRITNVEAILDADHPNWRNEKEDS